MIYSIYFEAAIKQHCVVGSIDGRDCVVIPCEGLASAILLMLELNGGF